MTPFLRIFVLFILVSAHSLLKAQISLSYRTDSINKKADAVIQSDERILKLADHHTAYYVHQIITLFNNNADQLANFIAYTDKDISLKSFHGSIINAYGETIRKIKRSDLKDQASMVEFATDIRTVYYEPAINTSQFPVTVEYEYELSEDYILDFPSWHPVPEFGVAVKHASFTVVCEKEEQVRFMEKNNAPAVSKLSSGNTTTYSWKLDNFAAIEDEDFSPEIEEVTPYVLLAPSVLAYDNYTNPFKTWEDFGMWMGKLNKDRDQVPEALKQNIITLTKDLSSNREKAKAIYEYMQSHTRYVSIQFGIGGFQPQPTATVGEKGYGDCKGLSNFTVALLRSVNIPAYYTLVTAGPYENIHKDFPANQFNHVIVCMPDGKDTLWLECTNQKMPFGYLSNFTDDRDVLVIADKPFVTHTRKYRAEDNQTITHATVEISGEGDAQFNFSMETRGLNSDDLFEMYNYLTQKEQLQKLSTYFAAGNMEIGEYSFIPDKEIIPTIELKAKAISREYARKSGTRLFVPLNILHPLALKAISDSTRKLPVCQEKEYVIIDTILFILPLNYSVESKSSDWKSTSVFGNYESTLQINGKEVLYTRKLLVTKGSFPADQYSKMYDYYKTIAMKDGIKLVLKKDL